MKSLSNRYGQQSRQQGIATVLVVVLVGLALTATSLGIMHSVRSTQEKHVAVHAVTNSQTAVWAGADAFRRYLVALESAELLSLNGNGTINFSLGSDFGSMSASNITVTTVDPTTYRVSADILNKNDLARSSAALGVTYEVGIASCANCNSSFSSVDFNDDLTITGGIDMIGASLPPDLNVNGNVTINQVALSPINQISSTGRVTLGSDLTVNHIFANDDVSLSGTTVNTVRTLGEFYANGDTTAQQVWANEDVEIWASGYFGAVNSVQNIEARSGTYGLIKAGGNILDSTSGQVDQAHAVGNITMTDWGKALEVIAMGDVSCVASNWGFDAHKFNLLSANGALNNCPGATPHGITQDSATNVVTPMNPEVAFSMSPNVVDVWALKGDANYIVEYDSAVSRFKVTVNNINGIPDGSVFYVGNYPDVDRDGDGYADYHYNYLCTTFDGSGKCSAPAEPLVPLCLAESLNQNCIEYVGWNNSIKIMPNNTAPGIMWIKGDVTFGNGFSATSFLVTGDIQTTGSFKSYSANYGAYTEVCEAAGTHVKDSLRAAFNDRFENYYPLNLCDKAGSDYTPIPTGNAGFVAGGYDPDGDGSFSGGVINISAASEIYGAVLAGDVLKTSGESLIYGAVTAAGQDASTSDSNLISARTVIDLTKSTDDYSATEMPSMGGGGGGGGAQAVDSVKVLWARYL